MPLEQLRDLLGHASITTTERYDNQKLENPTAPNSPNENYLEDWLGGRYSNPDTVVQKPALRN